MVFIALLFVEEAANKLEVLDILAKNLDAIFFVNGNVSITTSKAIYPKIKI